MLASVADNDKMRLQRVKHVFGIRAGITVMPGHNDIHRTEILADRAGSLVNGGIAGVDVGEIDHSVIAIGHDRHDGVDVFTAGIGLFIDVIQAEGHVSHGKGNIVAIGVARVAVDHLLLRDVNHVGTHILHGFGRLIVIGLVVPGDIGIPGKIILKVGDMLVFLIKICRIAVNQIAVVAGSIVKACCCDFRDAADMIHMGMCADDEIQMRHAQHVDHIPGNIFTVAHGDLVGILFRRGDGDHPAIGILNRICISVAGIHQPPPATGFNQNHVPLHAVKFHIEGIHPVRRIGDRILVSDGKDGCQDEEEGKDMEREPKSVPHDTPQENSEFKIIIQRQGGIRV